MPIRKIHKVASDKLEPDVPAASQGASNRAAWAAAIEAAGQPAITPGPGKGRSRTR
jgi:hypothetical protein